MDTECENLDLEAQYTDTFPLLMDQTASVNQHHILTVSLDSTLVQIDSTTPSTDLRNENLMSAETLPRDPAQVSTATTSSSTSSHVGLLRNDLGSRPRASPLNSGLWIFIEFIITVSQIVASIIVLTLSRDEKPQAPLSAWVAGYAAGCLATLPLLYWRYKHRYVHLHEHDAAAQSTHYTSNSSDLASSYVTLSLPSSSRSEEVHENVLSLRDSRSHVSSRDTSRLGLLIEKFKIALDCFFAVWFVVGNVWIFGGHSSSSEAPNLYRLCVVFLTFSCIGYAMPFILCATICCCLPCIIAVLGFREEQTQGRGASPEAIAKLPIYKFRTKSSKESRKEKDVSDSDSEGSGEGGFVASGTESERFVSADDAICCICLAKYKDGVELKELPCMHHFHVDCVDKWLKISACCPLCKHEVGGSSELNGTATTEAGGSTAQVSQEVEA
ncbi:hypothetical protein O6H91_21G012500 [Diphasiastrum complanatum]|uniref:Uncharacterized protein n=5 Tax=Diphasiastrum complanatum TaxID=34168 RepID=A0ACC2AJ91_DIPCM|nr:hypothetical protein O6H91_21G012500 [Diphasiastrum complanatum]KAJ7517159.1 hypothetical protein O6H91_21G012500 [Diphasiastrum complanatum]KAJ7517160.1 hypothetical protein O6H91_21G012500 [Diphasiastrum complanatum]KAJ7517161.1 hypothetical protein O6H91_21G012500 [Diphasiastrum complanatum]KAJ7517162.1 hypothetical protein O6H91_21G012500 [Diphasiastrum complanatum]